MCLSYMCFVFLKMPYANFYQYMIINKTNRYPLLRIYVNCICAFMYLLHHLHEK